MTVMTEVRAVVDQSPKLNDLQIGIRNATEWYNSHLQVTRPPVRGQAPPKIPKVVLMTEDAANRQKAEDMGIPTISG